MQADSGRLTVSQTSSKMKPKSVLVLTADLFESIPTALRYGKDHDDRSAGLESWPDLF